MREIFPLAAPVFFHLDSSDPESNAFLHFSALHSLSLSPLRPHQTTDKFHYTSFILVKLLEAHPRLLEH